MEHNGTTTGSDYRVEDREILLGFYRKILWDRLGDRIPDRISPNLITVLAQVFILIAALSAWLAHRGHPWLFVLSSVGLFLYLTADNLDGYHARRIGRSGPLGEFVDHGLDGIASGAALLCTAFTLQISGVWLVVLCAVGAIAWVVTFWEQYRRGVLVIAAIGTTEAFSLLICLQLLLLVLGSPSWLAFSSSSINGATVFAVGALIGYLWPIVPPIVRVADPEKTLSELGPLLLVTLFATLFLASGTHAVLIASLITIVSADLVARMVAKRSLADFRLFSPWDLAIMVPILAASIELGSVSANSWGLIGAAIVGGRYLFTLRSGLSELARPAPVA